MGSIQKYFTSYGTKPYIIKLHSQSIKNIITHVLKMCFEIQTFSKKQEKWEKNFGWWMGQPKLASGTYEKSQTTISFI